MITISDIAKLAGVAKSTVSRYLNGGSVGEATRKKIERVIEETGYSPNKFAQSLKAKKTNMIGTIVPRLDSFAASQTLIGIDEQLRALNYQLIISNSSQSLEREIENIYTLANQKVAGIILLATEITESHIEALRKVQIPIMLVGQQHEEYHSLIHNDYEASYELGKYVLENGHRRIAYLGVTERDVAVGVNRKKGFQKAVAQQSGCDVRYFETSFKIEDSINIVPEIMKDFHPSIFVCATDNIALGALKAAHIMGLNVPKDLSITGFGGYDITKITFPGITSAKFYYKEAGNVAAKNLVQLVNGEELKKVSLSRYKIIERESVDKMMD
ncbi:LacI family DNA-binding transcriptional regulator [Metabacillus arenae]|uniref:LacI family DNA-binding transcriptional regulator n=1 Tax=Metabacillus arenae TaxID=2771434 RepID=A0A926NN29_9BACI|nr:LacI family DNA-binding transcriptional regulator [Metabacillus arenae]MBD1382943.1 LacI family DNA-binding transcriptional regulator [Metabacillus arenae]